MWQYVADFFLSELPRKVWQSAEAVHAMKDPGGAPTDPDVLSAAMAVDTFNEAAFVERIWTQAPIFQGLPHGTRPVNPRNLAINMCFAYYRGGRVWFMACGHFLGVHAHAFSLARALTGTRSLLYRALRRDARGRAVDALPVGL